MDIKIIRDALNEVSKQIEQYTLENFDKANKMKNTIVSAHTELGQTIDRMDELATLMEDISTSFEENSTLVANTMDIYTDIYNKILDLEIPEDSTNDEYTGVNKEK